MKFTADVVIGLEIHAELNTKSKLFCGCPRSPVGEDSPNTRVCPICLGHPGSRPAMNAQAIEHAIKLALALGCSVSPRIVFSRKSYFYPDMSKNFQTTQFEEPLGQFGSVRLRAGRSIAITRIHVEEDPASLSYPGTMKDSSYALIDYNRSGNPLVEIVTEPVIATPSEAREFLNALQKILSYLKIFDQDTCVLKADANVSIKESNYSRVEIKNISGFKEIERALQYEITRQRALLRRGLTVKRETRGWNDVAGATFLMRTKETEDDYGYIIEPDLPVFAVHEERVAALSKDIPELAHQRADRYAKDHGLDESDAEILASEIELAELFELVAAKVDPQLAARWLRRELLRVLNYNSKTVRDIEFDETHIIELLSLVESNVITDKTAQRIMELLMEKPFSPKAYVQEHGLAVMGGDEELRAIIAKTIEGFPQAVADFKAGQEKSFHYLLGQVMRNTKGKADPAVTTKILKELLS